MIVECDLLQCVIHQIRRDLETLEDVDWYDDMTPGPEFYVERIESYREWAAELIAERSMDGA